MSSPPFQEKSTKIPPAFPRVSRSSTLALDLLASDTAHGTRQARGHGPAGETSDVAPVEGNDASGVAGTATDLDARLESVGPTYLKNTLRYKREILFYTKLLKKCKCDSQDVSEKRFFWVLQRKHKNPLVSSVIPRLYGV